MSKKSARIAALIEGCQGRDVSAHYLGYFECFNQGLFYEAHDVLEELWLPNRKNPEGPFYQGLIQFAGAFVHLQKNRLQPAARLFGLARANLQSYPRIHQQLDLGRIRELIEEWVSLLQAGNFQLNPLGSHPAPRLGLSGTQPG